MFALCGDGRYQYSITSSCSCMSLSVSVLLEYNFSVSGILTNDMFVADITDAGVSRQWSFHQWNVWAGHGRGFDVWHEVYM